jgi:hypothetical protein
MAVPPGRASDDDTEGERRRPRGGRAMARDPEARHRLHGLEARRRRLQIQRRHDSGWERRIWPVTYNVSEVGAAAVADPRGGGDGPLRCAR